MIKLNKAQLVTCWILSLLISYFILVGGLKTERFYKYESEDGWVWSGFASRYGELQDEAGRYHRISKKGPDGTEGRKYYYVNSYNEY